MLLQKLSLVSMLAAILMGCAPPIVGDATPDMDHSAVDMVAPIDQQPSQPPCPAAAGIPGDVLLCADFSRIQSLGDPRLANWNFNANYTHDCWQIIDNNLSNMMIPDAYYYCTVSLPAIDLTQPSVEKVNRITLAINYKLDLKDYQHAWIFLFSNVAGSRSDLIYHRGSTMGIQNILRTSTFTIEKSQLPNILNNVYKPYIELNAEYKNINSQGWQISSVAIIGAP